MVQSCMKAHCTTYRILRHCPKHQSLRLLEQQMPNKKPVVLFHNAHKDRRIWLMWWKEVVKTVTFTMHCVQRENAEMWCDLVPGGFFDGKTGADERRQYLLDLFKRSAQQEATAAALHSLSNDEVLMQLSPLLILLNVSCHLCVASASVNWAKLWHSAAHSGYLSIDSFRGPMFSVDICRAVKVVPVRSCCTD